MLNYIKIVKHIKTLSKKQIQFCLDKQKTADDFRYFAIYAENLTKKQIQFCLDNQKTYSDFRDFAIYAKNLSKNQLEECNARLS